MNQDSGLWRVVRWPALALAVAVVLIAAAFVLDATPAREWALTIGAPAVWFLLPAALVWLVAAVIVHAWRRQHREL